MAQVRVAIWHQGISADSLLRLWNSCWRWREVSNPKHMLRIERYGNGIRWGCTCQAYIPPGHTISCIPMTNGSAPSQCPDCGARSTR